MSLIGLYSCSDVAAPVYLSITTAAVNSLLAVAATTGNLLVLLAVIVDPNRNLRSRFNFLVANLAAADLMVGCVGLPMSVEFHIRESMIHEALVPNLPRDSARKVIILVSCTASLLSLATLTIERFIAIKRPLMYRTKMTTQQASIASLVIWVISIGLPFLCFQVGYLNSRFFVANLAVVTSFAVLCLTNVKIFKDFKLQANVWDNLQDGPKSENHAKIRVFQWQKKVTKTFLIMLGVFICCYLPALILIYVISFCANCHCSFIHWARDFNVILILGNSCMNPFVFAWRLKRYRAAFVKIIKCGRVG